MIVEGDGPSGAVTPPDSDDEEDTEVDDEIAITDDEDDIDGLGASQTSTIVPDGCPDALPEDNLLGESRPDNNYGTLGAGNRS